MKVNTHIHQPFHIVEQRPWPLTGSLRALTITIGLVVWFHYNKLGLTLIGLLIIILTIIQWWRDVLREASYLGHHTQKVRQLLKWGILLFITSEVLFFFAFFWAFFHRRLAPTIELGCAWPPTGIIALSPFSIPLLNTAVLLASGVTVTWAHHALINNIKQQFDAALTITVILGAYFTALQAIEYYEASFSIADSVYGSTFFVATGFHGLHVLIGTTFLIICLIRSSLTQLSAYRHFGFEAAAWYWHFVDVVWIFLYLCIYWWGGP